MSNGSAVHTNGGGGGGNYDDTTVKKNPMMSLEIEEDEEEEMDSLILETTEESNQVIRGLQTAHHRRNVTNGNSNSNGTTTTFQSTVTQIRGLLRSGIGLASTYRNFVMLVSLALFVFLLVNILNRDISTYDISETDNKPPPQYHPHEASFGGVQNSAHYNQPNGGDSSGSSMSFLTDDFEAPLFEEWMKNRDNNSDSDTNIIPLTGYIGMQVTSVTEINNDNQIGHYWHDPLHSPYASGYYPIMAKNSTIQAIENDVYRQQQQELIKDYGKWEQPIWPEGAITLAKSILPRYKNRDIPENEFLSQSWQLKTEYVTNLLKQAKLLVQRVKDGIYAEYGMGIPNTTTTDENEKEILKRRDDSFGIHFVEYDDHELSIDYDTGLLRDIKTREAVKGGVYMNKAAYEGLVRKLLHAIITEDYFYTVLVSAGDYSYRANNLFQTQIMQFQYLMEPVFNKLGMKLISRNMGMSATTTTVNTLAGADIYGESDILWYVPDPRSGTSSASSSTAEQTDGHFDLLHIQSIVSGQRVPIILSPNPGTLMKTNLTKEIWMGNIQPGYKNVCTNDNKDIDACKYISCNDDGHECGDEQYNSVCWVERSDYNPAQNKQDTTVGDYDKKYMNPNQHLLESRKLAMLVLHALDDALNRWMTEHNVHKKVPLPNDLWHVTDVYANLKNKVRVANTACDALLHDLTTEICHLEMHAYTEWTPRVGATTNRLKFISARQVADVTDKFVELYEKIDILPYQWKLPKDHIDVHMIALLSNTTRMEEDLKSYKPKPVLSDDNDDGDEDWMSNTDDGDDDDDYYFGTGFDPNEDGSNGKNNNNNNMRRRMQAIPTLSQDQWTVYNAPLGYCDGSSQSRCNRSLNNKCLLSGYNHYKAGLMGHGDSGPIAFQIHNVHEGIVLARFDWEDENVRPISELPEDFQFIYSVSSRKAGKTFPLVEQKKLSKIEFQDLGKNLATDAIIHPLWIDTEMAKNENSVLDIIVSIEIRSPSLGAKATILLSHLYYA